MRLFLPGAALLCLLCVPVRVFSAERPGPIVAGIELVDDQGRALPQAARLRPLISLKAGEPFSRSAVRNDLHLLYLKGETSDIRVETLPDGAGIRVVYRFFLLTVVDRVAVRGAGIFSGRARAVEEIVAGLAGKEYREDALFDIRTAIQARYQAEGYYNASVKFRSEPTADPRRVVLVADITEGPQTIVEEVAFSGNSVLPAAQLLPLMKNRPGRPVQTEVLFEQDLEAVLAAYGDAGYPAAKAGPVGMSFQGTRAFLTIMGDEGPKVTVRFSGNSVFSEAELRAMLLLWSEHDASDGVIDSSAEKIRDAYRERGYADARVEVKRTRKPGALDLAFVVAEGPRVTVREVRIEGNRAVPERQLRKLMVTRPGGWFGKRIYRDDVLAKDRETIAAFYAAAGHRAVEVNSATARSADGSEAVVTVTVAEGARTVVGEVRFEGNAAIRDSELAAVLKVRTGDAFQERIVEEDRYRLLSLYSNRGYLYARVEADWTAGPSAQEPETAQVLFRISEDRRVTVGRIILRGNRETKDSVIGRELLQKEGEPYRYEDILKSQQRLYRFGFFSSVRFDPVRPGAKEYVKDVLLTVEERPAGALEFGVGYGDLDRLRGFAELSHRNLFGTARSAALRGEGSDILKRAVFNLREPWWLGWPVEGLFVLTWSDAKRINQDSREVYYQTRKTTASYGVEKTFGGVKTSLTYQYENVDNYNVDPAAQLTPEDSGRVLISSLSPAMVWDLRDDPFNPRRGSLHGFVLKEAMGELGSEADFTKATVQTSWFVPAAERLVVALSGRAGMAWPHQGTAEVPLHERFYLGGNSTVRGFRQDSVGPYSLDANLERIPTGGSSMAQFNLEFRFMSAGGSGFVLFGDAGNVWVDRRILLGDLRASYGAGFRYLTPVGPLRIDYGQKIHRLPGESPGELHFNIGHAF